MDKNKNLGFSVAIGVAIGTAIGVATDNLAIWLPVGIALGAGIGTTLKKKGNKEDKVKSLSLKLKKIEDLLNSVGLGIEDFISEPESKEYKAAKFRFIGRTSIYRKAKQTPKKIGQFVTCWKRNSEGITEPFHENDDLDFYFIQTKSELKNGLFIFPKKELLKHGIVSTATKDGKRGFRVYPTWDNPISNQAVKTQQWQLKYFIDLDDFEKEKVLEIIE